MSDLLRFGSELGSRSGSGFGSGLGLECQIPNKILLLYVKI